MVLYHLMGYHLCLLGLALRNACLGDKHKAWKSRQRAQREDELMDDKPRPKKTRTSLQPSKKKGCTAKIVVNSMNYGSIGTIMGHEITHGFDDRGRQFDKYGDVKQLWKTSIIDNFKEKAQCFVDQFNKFIVPAVNLSVNGALTLGGNIADNGGIKQSFKAYRNWVEQNGKEEPMLPGLNLTHNQLFFLNFAQFYCENARPGGLVYQINSDIHTPNHERVIGTLQNSIDFSKAFGCKKNSIMNPEKKCYVW